MAAQFCLVFLLLIVCSFAPGFFLLRRLPWTPLEKLCASIGLSLTLIYLAAWPLYLLPVAFQTAGYFSFSAACVILAMLARRSLLDFLRIPAIRRALAGFAFLFAWSLSLLAMIRVYHGATWGGDWLEHFQRCLFFLHRFPIGTTVYRTYQLPSRPPLMNVLGAFFLGQTIDRYEVFQVIFVFLNLLPFLACCLILLALTRTHRRLRGWQFLPLAAIFAMNPLVMQSALYTWTKALAAFFVILAIALYLAALRKRDSRRLVAAFLALSAGFLVHYSAGPYIVILTLHYLITAFPKRAARWKEAVIVAGLCGALLLTWFGWSLAAYGLKGTIASNSSITLGKKYEGNTLEKIGGNLWDSLVPQVVRSPASVHRFDQPNSAGMIRDNVFIVYQANLIFGLGLFGGPLVIFLLLRLAREKAGESSERRFWLALIPAAIVLGIAVVGERDVDGVAHLTLVPLVMLGLTCLAVNFGARRWIAIAILAGSTIDFGFGVLLHARIQNLENTPERTVFSSLSVVRGLFYIGLPVEGSLSPWAWDNWFHKHEDVLAREWLAQTAAYHGQGPAFERSAARFHTMLQQSVDEDQTLWRGWFSRHQGSVTLVGDAFGEAAAPWALLMTLWLGLLALCVRHLPAPYAIPIAAPRSAPRTAKKSPR